ncbi:hypothetical protein [Actinoallomurus iriomotensis]|uniref:Transglycosylase SLT domain-containing protein n=1 Tax=Actinoallomurus iriomotensis TaxID=478107 RepID=A0A9W6VUG6_9ACTN|nr:hypothetical protein [Actinoallomurus iriomotensis]GLY80750.1 hypothetical protein Airi01_090170 [Actinoallomurus iriomotensis]
MSVTYGDVMKADPSMLNKSAGVWKDWADAVLVHAGYLKEQVGQHIEKQHWDGPPAVLARGKVDGTHAGLLNSAERLRSVEGALISAGKAFDEAKNTLVGLTSEAQSHGLQVDAETGHLSYTAPAVGTVVMDTYGKKALTQADVTNLVNAAQGYINDLQPRIDAAVEKAGRADTDLSQTLAGLAPPRRSDSDQPTGDPGPYGVGGSGGLGPSASGDTSTHSASAGEAQAYAKSLMAQYGWSESDWESLVKLWNQESGWNANAVNPSSGAAGIPQALGHGHVFDLGDYKAQIQWGLNYIRDRYGSPNAAWAHEVSHNWY